MNVGRAVGTAILALVDAMAAGAVAGLAAFLAMPVVFVSTRTQLTILVAAGVTGVVLALALALAGLGQRPFPATRLAKGVLDRVPWWA